MASFGITSERRIVRACPELEQTARSAILILDFSVIETTRDQETQNRYFEDGVSE